MSPTLKASRNRQQMSLLYRAGWLFFRLVFATYFRWRHFNRERVPAAGPVILASNHTSYIDPPLIGTPLSRPVSYLARENLFRSPAIGWLLRNWNVVPVDREGGGARGLRRIFEALQSGSAVLLFPEGTRSPNGRLQTARSGIALLVLKSKAPVIPTRVFGTFEAYGRHLTVPRPFPISVKYGKPLLFEALRREAETCDKPRLKGIYQEITDQIMAAIAALRPWQDHEQFPAG